MHILNCLLNAYQYVENCTSLTVNFSAIKTDLRAISIVTYFEKSPLTTGEINLVPGTAIFLANIKLLYFWVVGGTFVFLCWEMLKISLQENLNMVTVGKILPGGRYTGQPINSIWLNFDQWNCTLRWGIDLSLRKYFLYSCFISSECKDSDRGLWINKSPKLSLCAHTHARTSNLLMS